MNRTDYTLFHPRWYRRRMPIFWWLGRLVYTKFIVRELTSLAVGYTVLLLLVTGWLLGRGPEALEPFLAWTRTPWVVVWHGLVLVGLVVHSVTWLNLAPKALVIRLGRRRLSDPMVVTAHYAAWLAVSLVVLWWMGGRSP
jgi:fumarate reductase subunit C